MTVHQYDIVLDVSVQNRTNATLQNLNLELATMGDLKLVERPQNYTLGPGASRTIRANIKVLGWSLVWHAEGRCLVKTPHGRRRSIRCVVRCEPSGRTALHKLGGFGGSVALQTTLELHDSSLLRLRSRTSESIMLKDSPKSSWKFQSHIWHPAGIVH